MTGQRPAQRIEEDEQPAAAGVHHARGGQHLELGRGSLQGGGRRPARFGDHLGQHRARSRRDLGRGGDLLQHRHDGARDELAHRGHREADGVPERRRQQCPVDVGQSPAPVRGRLGAHVGQTAQDLRQDHP